VSHSPGPQGRERNHLCELGLDGGRRLHCLGRPDDGAERAEETLMLYELAQIIVLSKDLHVTTIGRSAGALSRTA